MLYLCYQYRDLKLAFFLIPIIFFSLPLQAKKTFSKGLSGQVLNLTDSLAKDSIPWNSFNNLRLGIITSSIPSEKNSSNDFFKRAIGLDLGMGTSFTLAYFAPQKNHKLKVGDIFRGNIVSGYLNNEQSPSGYKNTIPANQVNINPVKTGLWTAYRFEIGLTTIYNFKKNVSTGLNFIPLIFAHDQLSQNISGSSVSIWLRLKRVVLETGIEARRERFIGFKNVLSQGNLVPQQFHYKITYIANRNRQAGVEFISYPNALFNTQDSRQPTAKLDSKTVRIYYGISF